MADYTKVLFKIDQFVPTEEKKEWEATPAAPLDTSAGRISEPTNLYSKQQTIELHVTAPDVDGLVSSRLRITSAWLHFIAALIIGFNKYFYRSDSDFSYQPSLSKMQTLNIILCVYSLRLWKMGSRMEKRKRPHICILPLAFIFILDQAFSWLMLIICSSAWTTFTTRSCVDTYGRGYCRRTQAGVAASFLAWAFLLAPCVLTLLRLAVKLRDGMIVANANARRSRKSCD
ncbi:hypothetical protein R1flu_018476 [Riccia fluitans]|uniref:CASP-like protein n=1 Tax=Riccia fluitans TaxID=41844 RepID=A0ABD1ZFY8_9MARC